MTGLEAVLYYLLASLLAGCIAYVRVKRVDDVNEEAEAVSVSVIIGFLWPVILVIGIPTLGVYGFSRIYNKLTKRKIK